MEETGLQRFGKFRNGTIKVNPMVLSLFVVCLILCATYVLVLSAEYTNAFSFVNKALPSLLLLACSVTGYFIVRRDPLLMWSPLPWFIAICAILYGFGPLQYHFGTPEDVWIVDQFYPVEEIDLLRTNMLNAAGISSVLLGYLVGMALIDRGGGRTSQITNIYEMKRLLFVLLVVGISVKYLLVVPYRTGILGWVLPGSIQNLSRFTWIAIIVLFVLVHNGSIKYRIPLYCLVGTELIVGLMSWSRFEVIVVLLMILLGKFLCEQRIDRFIAGCALIGLFYVFFLSPFATFGRISVRLEGAKSVGELSNTFLEYLQEERFDALGQLPGSHGWWSRLNYANAQTFAMNSYDSGNPGDTYSYIPYTVVPRILYPEKPIMTLGTEFNELVTGSAHSASAAGLFGEAYWNGGWPLVIISSIIAGFVYSIFTIMSIRHILEWNLAYLPVTFIGITMGMSPDNSFVTACIGTFVQAVILYISIRYLIMPIITEKYSYTTA